MAVEVLEVQDEITPAMKSAAAAATQAAAALDNVRQRVKSIGGSEVQALVNAFGEAAGKTAIMSTQLEAVAQAERHVTAEVQRQISLQAQISTFDANRVRQTHALEQELSKLRDQATGGHEAAAKAAEASAKSSAEMGAGILVAYDAAKQLASALWDAAKAAASVTLEGAKLGIEMSNFKSESLRVFETFTGSKAAAEEMFESVKHLANITGEAPEAVAGRMKKLLAEGFKAGLAGDILQAQADVFAALGETEASKLEGIFEKLHNKGALDQKTITSLARAGVDTQRVYESLASHLHKSVDQVKADLKAGTIAGDEAAAAIAEAVEGKYGGSAQRRADNDIFVMFARIRNDARALFENIDIGPVKEAAKSLIEALEGPGGKELASGLQDMFGSIFHALFDPFKGPEGVAKLQNIMHAIGGAMYKVAEAARAVAPYIATIVELISRLTASGTSAEGGVSTLNRIADAMQIVFRMLTGLAAFDTDGMQKLFEGLFAGFEAPDLGSVGSDMIDGLIGGIEAGAAGVVNALVGVCKSAIDAAESALQIGSPSRVFHEIGNMTSAGFAGGIAGNDSPSRAASSMAAGAAGAANVSAPSMGRAAGGGGDVHVTVQSQIIVNANDAQGGAEAGAAAAPQVNQAHHDAATRFWRDRREEAA